LSKDVDLRDVLKNLKTKMACGGTLKDNIIMLQGDHRKRIKQALVNLGFAGDKIEVS
jgi:translation initiation factor 1